MQYIEVQYSHPSGCINENNITNKSTAWPIRIKELTVTFYKCKHLKNWYLIILKLPHNLWYRYIGKCVLLKTTLILSLNSNFEFLKWNLKALSNLNQVQSWHKIRIYLSLFSIVLIWTQSQRMNWNHSGSYSTFPKHWLICFATEVFCHLPFQFLQSFLTDINSACISILSLLQKVNIFRRVSSVQWIYQSHIFSFFLFTKVWLYSVHLPFHSTASVGTCCQPLCWHTLFVDTIENFRCRLQ